MPKNIQNSSAHKPGVSVAVIVRFAIIGVIWLGLCGWFVARVLATGERVTFLTIFPLLASGIVVFVPLYKKYVRKDAK